MRALLDNKKKKKTLARVRSMEDNVSFALGKLTIVQRTPTGKLMERGKNIRDTRFN